MLCYSYTSTQLLSSVVDPSGQIKTDNLTSGFRRSRISSLLNFKKLTTKYRELIAIIYTSCVYGLWS